MADDIRYDDIVKRWREKNIIDEASLDIALSNYRVLFAYHSNQIEDAGLSFHQTREIFENGKTVNFTGDPRAVFETQNQKACYDFLRKKIADKEMISEELICDVHFLLNQGCYDESRWLKGERPGTYKRNYYGVGDNAGILPEDVSDEIKFICEEIKNCVGSPEDILTTAAYFHCNFESIHPFADGNGRAGRTLMNYFLMINNMPPLIIYEEDRETYYLALTIFDKTEKLDGFVRFLKEQTIKTWVKEPSLRTKQSHKIICI